MLTSSAKKANEGSECYPYDMCLPISRLELMECVYPKLSDVTTYSQSKEAVMSAQGNASVIPGFSSIPMLTFGKISPHVYLMY